MKANVKKKNESKIIMKQWVRVFLILAVIAVMVVSALTIYKALNPKQVTRKALYTYNYNSNMNYKVYLKQNSYFNVPYLGMNKQYITSLIDHIEVDTKYDFKSDKKLEYIYDYEIIATARGMYENTDGKKVDVWSKAYPISTKETKSGSGETFSIGKTVNLDYNTFNQILTDFRTQFGLSVDARVDLSLRVNVSAGLPGAEKTLNDSYTANLIFPLLSQTMKVQPDYINAGGDTVYEKVDPKLEMNIPLLGIGVALLLVSLVVFKKLVGSLLVVTRKSEYVLAVNKIMKDYADIIAETHNMPDLAKYDVVNIKTFNDMVDIEEELHSPIIYFEIEEDAKCVFLILNENTAYRYLLRDIDFDHFGGEK